MTGSPTRRQVIGSLAAGTALGTLPRAAIAAAPERLIVGNWGGDSQTLTQDLIGPKMKAENIRMLFDIGGEPARKVKVLAERALPRGRMDIAALTDSGAFELWKNDALDAIDYTRISAASRIIPTLRKPYAVPKFYSTCVILYNPEKVNPAPRSFADLWNPAYAKKVGSIDIQYQSTIASAALAFGGSVSNYEPGKAKLLELKKAGTTIYPTNEAMAEALKSGACWMCIMWQARGVMWQDADIPVKIAFPNEGLQLAIFSYAVPKNAPDKKAAYAFLNAALETDVQAGFARKFGYDPAVTGVPLDPAYKARITIPKAFENKVLVPDDEYLLKNDAQLKDWWDRVLKTA